MCIGWSMGMSKHSRLISFGPSASDLCRLRTTYILPLDRIIDWKPEKFYLYPMGHIDTVPVYVRMYTLC